MESQSSRWKYIRFLSAVKARETRKAQDARTSYKASVLKSMDQEREVLHQLRTSQAGENLRC